MRVDDTGRNFDIAIPDQCYTYDLDGGVRCFRQVIFQ